MRNRRATAIGLIAGITMLIATVTVYDHRGLASARLTQTAPVTPLASLQGDKAVEHLKQQGLYDSLERAAEAARFEIRWEERPAIADLPAAYHAHNSSQRLNAYFNAGELRIASDGNRDDDTTATHAEWHTSIRLIGYGYGSNLSAIEGGQITAKGNRIEINKSAVRNPQSAIVEWYVNKTDGLEQGFTIETAPGTGTDGNWLRLAMELKGDLKAEMAEGAEAVALKRENPEVVLRYGDLLATDATGRTLPSRIKLDQGQLLLEVDDTNATYPLLIDPNITQQQKLTPSDGASNDFLGLSVAISGDTAVVGAPYDDDASSDLGSAYVFIRTGTSWIQQQKLSANDAAANDAFGYSVAISGETIVVGAPFDTAGANSQQGSAYVFVRIGASWSQQQKLTAVDGAAGDFFGFAVSISGDTVAAGAFRDAIGTQAQQGSLYVFVRSGTSWSQQQKLTASDGSANDHFGGAVGISGNTVIVGSPNDQNGLIQSAGSAYVFVRSGTSWSQQTKLTESSSAEEDLFGRSVAISGNTVVVGSGHAVGTNARQGTAYVFVRSGTSWSQQTQLIAADGAAGDLLGASVAISGETIAVGADGDGIGSNAAQGSAYIFTRSGTSWSQRQKLTAVDGAASDRFGGSISISGDTVVVGASSDDVGANVDQGSAYAFGIWGAQQKLFASDGIADDRFGLTVAVSGDTAVVGAPRDDIGFNGDQGSAYVFVRNGLAWSQQQKLTASDGLASDFFGNSVAINGNTIVAGSYLDDTGSNNEQGAAYVFVRTGTTWSQQQKLTATDGATTALFGSSVAVGGDTIVVGAAGATIGANAFQGAAYVFVRGGSTWSQQAKLTADDGAAGDVFGDKVGFSGQTAVVGAQGVDIGPNANQGSAYVFVRNGASWSQQQKLIAGGGIVNEQFGISVAINGETIIAGASGTTVGSNTNQGSAYVFVRTGTSWNQQQQLTALDGGSSDFFGDSVGISGETVVIGADNAFVGSSAQGAAFVFVRSGTSWSQQQKLTAADGAPGDNFGLRTAIDGDTVVVGAPGDDFSQGSAYVYIRACQPPNIVTQPSNQTTCSGLPASFSVTATGSNLAFQWHKDGSPIGSGGNISGATSPVLSINPATGNDAGSYTVVITGECGLATSSAATLTVNAITLSALSQSFPAGGGNDSINITTTSGCIWTAGSNVPWVTVTSGGSGIGNGTVNYAVTSHVAGTPRTGTITIAGQTFTVSQGAHFNDVPPSHLFYTVIGKLSARGVTVGCGGGNYCPNDLVTREQMAAFIIRALGMFNPPPPANQRFADVPPSNIFYGFIEQMALRQITLGCGGGNYCPASPVLRDQMAAFLIRALGEPNPPAPASQRFNDVPASNLFYNFIDRMAVLNITLGCQQSPPLYCPADSVTRAQMAAFLVRAFNL